MVAQYRAAMAEHVAEPAWKALVRRLHHASPEFSEVWARHEVRPLENRTKQVKQRDVGLLSLDYTNLWFGQRTQMRFVTYSPADAETADRLTRLQALLQPSGDLGAA
jgi:hypothetical protein